MMIKILINTTIIFLLGGELQSLRRADYSPFKKWQMCTLLPIQKMADVHHDK